MQGPRHIGAQYMIVQGAVRTEVSERSAGERPWGGGREVEQSSDSGAGWELAGRQLALQEQQGLSSPR